MPFPWYHPDVPREYTDRPDKALQMYTLELKERAALLMRLGYSQEETIVRLRGNVRWDFELHRALAHADRVMEIVQTVFRARGLAEGGPPSLDG